MGNAAVAATLALLVLPGGSPAAQPPPAATDPVAEAPEALPDGHGREDTFYRCTACHGTAVIRRSRLSRDRWDELMDWMTERHGMPPLEGDERRLIVDYLAGAFPPQEPRRRGPANPFLTN
ncbi:hypothetical protein EAH89_05320 [Roseomonas nepalensis]|uniref:Aldehyde dehydrogenase n=1 Tax=Muricoccus nepalensis TaxID=1854500 RepID=A0A502GC40_9PROT|nr:hypothetical protein EAH89_05320 [Roseomonas nepalensis]